MKIQSFLTNWYEAIVRKILDRENIIKSIIFREI